MRVVCSSIALEAGQFLYDLFLHLIGLLVQESVEHVVGLSHSLHPGDALFGPVGSGRQNSVIGDQELHFEVVRELHKLVQLLWLKFFGDSPGLLDDDLQVVIDDAPDGAKSPCEEGLNHLLLDWIHFVATALVLLLDLLIFRALDELLPFLVSLLVVVLERADFEVSQNVFTEALDSLLGKLFEIIGLVLFELLWILEASFDDGYSLQAASDAAPPEAEDSLDELTYKLEEQDEGQELQVHQAYSSSESMGESLAAGEVFIWAVVDAVGVFQVVKKFG